MSITKQQVKSCCGGSTFILDLPLPLRKFQVQIFKDNGWNLPDNFYNAGVCYIMKNGLTVTGSYGAKKLNAKGKLDSLDEFINLLEQAIQLK